MPKKFSTENQRASASKARKEAAKAIKTEQERQREEELLWKEDDKNILRKLARRDSLAKKKQATIDRKMEQKQLIMLEQEKMMPKKHSVKLTRAQIEINKKNEKNNGNYSSNILTASPATFKLEENLNRIDEVMNENARNITEAIKILSVDEDGTSDKHPEKRRKSAYIIFEERRLSELKIENPHLNMSQYKNIIFKEWQKYPDNPINRFGKMY